MAQLDYGIAYPRHNLYGMLRAHATGVGPWERFQFCYDKRTNVWSILSNANGRWAVTSWTIRLVTNTCFAPTPQGSGYGSSTASSASLETMGRSRSTPAASDRYVAAELGKGKDYGMLRARSDMVGPWEQFFPFPACLR